MESHDEGSSAEELCLLWSHLAPEIPGHKFDIVHHSVAGDPRQGCRQVSELKVRQISESENYTEFRVSAGWPQVLC